METTKELYNEIVSDIKDIEIIYFDRLNRPEQWRGYYDEVTEIVFFDKVKQIKFSEFGYVDKNGKLEKSIIEDLFILQKDISNNCYNLLIGYTYHLTDHDGWGCDDLGYQYEILKTESVSKENGLYYFINKIDNKGDYYECKDEDEIIPDNIDPSNYILHKPENVDDSEENGYYKGYFNKYYILNTDVLYFFNTDLKQEFLQNTIKKDEELQLN